MLSTRGKGFTLTELVIALAVLAVGAALAVPSWQNLLQKRKIAGAANEIASFLNHAQSEAIKRHEPVTVTVKRNAEGTSWCIGAVNESQKDAGNLDHCECDAAPGHPSQCSFDGQPQSISHSDFEGLTMDALVADDVESLGIHFNLGSVSGLKMNDDGWTADHRRHALSMRSANPGFRLQMDIPVTGRALICSPDSRRSLPRFYTCQQQAILPIGGLAF